MIKRAPPVMWRRIAPRPLYPKGLRILRHITAKGTYPPPELPGFAGTTDLSATLPGPACPSRDAGWRVRATARASRVAFHLPLARMPPPLPRRRRPVLADRPTAAFGIGVLQSMSCRVGHWRAHP